MAVRHDSSALALDHARKRLPKVKGGRGSGLTPRQKRAVEAFVHGIPDMPPDEPVTMDKAAEFAGLTARTFRDAMKRPAVEAYFQAEMRALRLGERPANLRKLKQIIHDPEMVKHAAGARAITAAIEVMELDPDVRNKVEGVNVSVAVQNTVAIQPGYVIRLGSRAARQIEHDAAAGPVVTVQDQDGQGEAGGAPFVRARAPE